MALVVGSARELLWASPNWVSLQPIGTEDEQAAPFTGAFLGEILEDPRAGDLVGTALATGEVQRGEIGQDGWRRVLRAVVAPLGSAKQPMVLLVLSDITPERRLTRAHQELIANLSHDLRTPLASLTLLAETLNGAARDDPEATRLFAGRIAAEADRLHNLVAGILDLARLQAGAERAELADVELRGLVDRVTEELMPQAESRRVTVAAAGGPVMARADPGRLARAFANILDNAIKFSHHEGRVEVLVEGNQVGPRITVRDSGRGISAATMARIFDRFYTGDRSRSRPGGGLGLSIAKEAVELQGGEITVESTPGEGTLVEIRLRPTASN